MLKILYLTHIIILLLFSYQSDAQGERVRLQDITALTLRRGESTTGRRSSPVPQLQCIGGTAKGQYSPKVVQCYNRGFDGRDVQWECKADISRDYQFGKIDVSCEGYDYPADPYILAGSCGLRYELDYTASGAKKGAYHKASAPQEYEDHSKLDFPAKILLGVVAAFIIYTIYRSLTTPTEGEAGGHGGGWFGGGGGGGGPGYPPPPGDGPPPYGWQPPPSYNDSTQHNKGPSTSTGTSGSSRGPGFFTGMGLGALGGYLFGNRGNTRRRFGGEYFGGGGYNDHYDTPSSSYYDGPSTSSSYYRESPSSSSSSTHQSSGFGGTSRR